MRIYKYWQSVSEDIEITFYSYHLEESSKIITTNINGKNRSYQRTTCYGGSNISIEDAKIKAQQKLERLKALINGAPNDLDYEVDICEELIYKLNESNLITRNRYGALVLNTDEIMFIDVDSPKITFSRLIYSLFGSKIDAKKLMLKDILTEINKPKHQHFSFRIYETFKGYRIIVCGAPFDPKSKSSNRIMIDFNADYLYRILCKKQECYRARLTPKPFRVGLKNLNYKFPRIDKYEKERLLNWVNKYDEKSKNYASCKFISAHNYTYKNNIVELHDKITDAYTTKPLA